MFTQAISLDTNIFEKYHYNFSYPKLYTLRHLKDNHIRFIMTKITYLEILHHYTDNLNIEQNKLHSALNFFNRHHFCTKEFSDSIFNSILNNKSTRDLAKQHLDNYIKTANIEIILEDNININGLIDMYFNSTPPFENHNNKKHEFPDALTLMTLESWAISNNIPLRFITYDKGCLQYSSNSTLLTVSDNLNEIINLCAETELSNNIIKFLSSTLIDKTSDLYIRIIENIKRTIEYMTPELDVVASYATEVHGVSCEYIRHEFRKSHGNLLDVTLLEIKEHSLQLEITAHVDIYIKASVSYLGYDSEDNSYYAVNSHDLREEHKYEMPIIIELHGQFNNIIAVEKIESVTSIDSLDYVRIEGNI